VRYDGEHKQRTRDAILAHAAQAIRAAGPDRIGVKDVMARAGLTQGGFYAHFASKEDLVAAAIETMFEGRRQMAIDAFDGREPRAGLIAYVDSYLSDRHRRNPALGCPLPALSADIARMPEEARETFAAGMERLIAMLAEKLGAAGHDRAEPLARSILAEMIGALALSRAVTDDARAAAILAASRESILARL